ncbi:MAG: response regulator [Candidatus Heimdallarchaeota archaeon]
MNSALNLESSINLIQQKQLFALSVEDSLTDFRLLEVFLSDHFPSIRLDHVVIMEEMFERLERQYYDVILLDLNLGLDSSIHIIPKVLQTYPMTEIIVVSGQDDVRTALECISYGVSYITKGEFLETDLIKTMTNVVKLIISKQVNSALRETVFQDYLFPIVLFKLGKTGTDVLLKDFDQFPEPLEVPLANFLTKLGIHIGISIGQGHLYHEGLFQLPAGSSKNFQVLVYTFRLKDKLAHDPRMKVGFFQFCLFFPKHLVTLFPPLAIMEKEFKEQHSGFNSAEDLNYESFLEIKNKIIAYLSKSFLQRYDTQSGEALSHSV